MIQFWGIGCLSPLLGSPCHSAHQPCPCHTGSVLTISPRPGLLPVPKVMWQNSQFHLISCSPGNPYGQTAGTLSLVRVLNELCPCFQKCWSPRKNLVMLGFSPLFPPFLPSPSISATPSLSLLRCGRVHFALSQQLARGTHREPTLDPWLYCPSQSLL